MQHWLSSPPDRLPRKTEYHITMVLVVSLYVGRVYRGVYRDRTDSIIFF